MPERGRDGEKQRRTGIVAKRRERVKVTFGRCLVPLAMQVPHLSSKHWPSQWHARNRMQAELRLSTHSDLLYTHARFDRSLQCFHGPRRL
jgi:hypothetical protein